MQIIRKRAFARAGLLGNPSDGYNGKTISLSVRNFWAEVVLYEWDTVEIVLAGKGNVLVEDTYSAEADAQLLKRLNESPALKNLPSGVTTTIPNRLGSTFASAGMSSLRLRSGGMTICTTFSR